MLMRSLRLTRYAIAAALLAAPVVSHAQIAVLSSTVEERVAAPGEKYSGTIVLSNPTAQPQMARIYQTDYQFSADGTSAFDDAGSTARSNATWVTPQSTRIEVPANSQLAVSYSVTVPKSDSLRGTYWSVIMVEGLPNDAGAKAAASAKPSVQLPAVIRYAIQVATHISFSGSRAVKFIDATAKHVDGKATLDVDVHDAGDRAYRPTMWVEVYDAQGTLRAKAKQSRGLLYPGSSLRQHFELGALPAGTYKAVVFADSGDDSVFAAQYTITF
jgi:hypothetical protein